MSQASPQVNQLALHGDIAGHDMPFYLDDLTPAKPVPPRPPSRTQRSRNQTLFRAEGIWEDDVPKVPELTMDEVIGELGRGNAAHSSQQVANGQPPTRAQRYQQSVQPSRNREGFTPLDPKHLPISHDLHIPNDAVYPLDLEEYFLPVGRAIEASVAIVRGGAKVVEIGIESLPKISSMLERFGVWGSKVEQSKFVSGTDIVEQTSRELAAKGPEYLKQYMSRKEWDAYIKDPENGSRFLGQAVHRGTDLTLRDLYPGRFKYSTIGPDFLDKTTGELIELTTPKAVQAHLLRDPNVNIVTYELPKLGVE